MKNKLGLFLSHTLFIVILLSGLMLPFFQSKPALAASVIVVNSQGDSLSNDGKCTLREAIIAANKSKPSGSKANECIAGSTDNIIRLEANKVYQILKTDSGNEDSSSSGDLDIRSNITFEITGSGLATIEAVNAHDRVFQVFSGTATFSNLVISGGNLSGTGGAIANFSTVMLRNSLIQSNTATLRGGGIFNATGAKFTILNSTITGNSSSSDGGGITNEGILDLSNTTISGNTSKGGGGGLYSKATTTLNAVTIAANSAGTVSGNGGGIAVAAGVTTIKNTLIGGNTSSAVSPAPDCSGNLSSAGYNLLQNTTGCVLSGNLTGNLVGVNPVLGSLANNGGLTPTHAISTSSPALEAGSCTTSDGNTLTEDQRGLLRPQGNTCDIGAFELINPVQSGPTYSVTSIIDVTSTACTVLNCSLRDALIAANSRPNGLTPDEIHFNFPGSGVHIINLHAPLPAITDAVVIDGFSQPGASPNTLPTGSNSVRLVTLDGSQLGACSAGLSLSASNSLVRGLNIQNFACDGIAVNGASNRVTDTAISGNAGAGVHVFTGAGNAISMNSIFANSLGGIVLEPNANQNQAVSDPALAITRVADAIPSTDVGGEFTGLPNSSYTIEVFHNPVCSNAQGKDFLLSTNVSTDSNGNGSFLANIKPPLAQGSGVTITITGPDGSTSTFSGCIPVGVLNDSWLAALPLSLTPSGGLAEAEITEKIYQPGQSRWYKFHATPGGKVFVTVTGQPGTVISLHRDLIKTYKNLETPDEAGALAANDLPGGYLPGGYLPGGYLPGGYLPGGYLPGGYLPGGYLPGGYLPGGYLPGGYLPGGYLPGGYLPGGYLPGGYLPADYLPGGYLPGGYLPELYSGSIRRSLLSIAYNGQSEQTIEKNTWDLSEDFYIQVSGPASLSDSINLQVSFQSGICENVPSLPEISANLPVIFGTQPQPGASETLILWDSLRMLASDPSQDVEALRVKLAEFASRPDILGQVIDLASLSGGSPLYPRVAQANQIADAHPSCITAKNTVATEIKHVVEAYREANSIAAGTTTLKYILLVGSDHEIPFFRYPDLTGFASEADYIPPVKDASASDASLRQSQVLGQDEYGAQYQAARSGYTVPLPQLAVGRLVRTVEQISGILDAYAETNGMITPQSALVTGYDFVADAAEAVQTEFNLGLNSSDCASQPSGCKTVETLLQPQADGLVGAWSADDLRGKLFPASNEPSDLIFFAGHFSAGSVLAADYSTSIPSSELYSSPVDFKNALVFALGCHSGYNIPALDALAFSPTPDWAETFAQKGATYIAATGYAYGDTDLTEYGERLYLSLAQKIRTGSAPVAIGQALVESKSDYLAARTNLEGIDDKTLLETTLYGLPMLKVNFTGERINQSGPATIAAAAPVSSGPGVSLGLSFGQPVQGGGANVLVLNPALTRHNVPLTNVLDQTPVTATYYSGVEGSVSTRPAEPVFPLERYNVKVDGQILRGVGFRGGTYSDESDVTPLTSAATTENSRGHPGFFSDFFYPVQNWAANYYDAIEGLADWLVITPAQYRSNSLTSSTGTMRTYQEMDLRLYYLDQDWPQSPNALLRAAALSASPDIRSILALPGSSSLHFVAEVIADPSAGVQEVWVTYTAGQGTWYGTWKSLDLVQSTSNPLLWEGDLPLPIGTAPADVHFIVQAANGTGSVSLVDPSLPRTTGIPTIENTLLPTHINLDPVNATGFYNEAGLVTATLLDTSSGLPIQERTIVFAISNNAGQVLQIQPAITNYAGQASLKALKLPVGVYTLSVYYGSTVNLAGEVVDLTASTYLGSSASGSITLENAPVLARDDAYTVDEDATLVVSAPGVLGNDADLEGGPITAILASSPASGSLVFNADGSFSYSPNPDFNGSDSFSYTASDGYVESSPATVTLTVNPVEDLPVARSDSATTSEDTPIAINVLANDSDVDHDQLTVVAVGTPTNGLAATDGVTITYTPGKNYYGPDQFEYTVSDGVQSVTSTVDVTVTPVNDDPVCSAAVPDSGIWIWPPNNHVLVPVHISGIVDPEGDPVSVIITAIYQDEPVGSGSFSPDGMGVGTDTAMVRAERDGNGDGRVYHIFFTASDSNGGNCTLDLNSTAKVRVGVFDNQGSGGLDPIDDGAIYDSTLSQAAASIMPSETANQTTSAFSFVLAAPLTLGMVIKRRQRLLIDLRSAPKI